MRALDGVVFSRVVRAGALAVMREQEALNHINVFPVRDADTGANLAATLRSAAARLGSVVPGSVGAAARAAADGALDGARGNSGAIFAQFLHGLASGLDRKQEVDGAQFAGRDPGHGVGLLGPAGAARGHHPVGAQGLVARAAQRRARGGLRRDDAPRARGGARRRSPRRRGSSRCWPAVTSSTPAARASSSSSRASSRRCAAASRRGCRSRRRRGACRRSRRCTTRSTTASATAPRRC